MTACVIASVVGAFVVIFSLTIWLAVKHGEWPDIRPDQFVVIAGSMLGMYPACILVTVLFVLFVDRRTLASIGLTATNRVRDIALGTLLGTGFVGLMAIIYAALGWVQFAPAQFNLGEFILATLVLYPLIGVTEELVFRGYLMQTLDEWRGRRLAIGVTTLLFWLPHIPQGNVGEPLGAASMLTLGLVFALCRYATGSLWLPIALHAAYDWGVFSLMGSPELPLPGLLHVKVTVPHWLVGPPGHVGVADLAFGLLLLAGVYLLLYRPASPTQPAGE